MVVRGGVLSLGLLFALAAQAEVRALEGFGRVSVLGGWRLTPNDYFFNSATNAGAPPVSESRGGPQLGGSFAYAATSWIEVSIDLFGGTERLNLEGWAPLQSTTYGALLGVRFQRPGLLAEELVPSIGLMTGPALVLVSSQTIGGAAERLQTAYAASAGLTWRLGDRFGVSVEYRLMLVRGMVPTLGGVNGGGSWFSLGFTTYLPPEPAVGIPF